MGWVVKEFRPDGVAAVVARRAEATAQSVLQAAEREARRMQRTAERERREAQASLDELEALAAELHAGVRGQRQTLHAGAVVPARREVAGVRDAPPGAGLRARRSRLRDSPLASLFQATDRRAPDSAERLPRSPARL